jgi:hypothetical protein
MECASDRPLPLSLPQVGNNPMPEPRKRMRMRKRKNKAD